MKVEGQPYRTIWLSENGWAVNIIDQTKLPFEFVVVGLETLDDGGPGVVLATAHPAKFREEIEATLGIRVELPARLARCLELPTKSITIAPRLEALLAALRA